MNTTTPATREQSPSKQLTDLWDRMPLDERLAFSTGFRTGRTNTATRSVQAAARRRSVNFASRYTNASTRSTRHEPAIPVRRFRWHLPRVPRRGRGD